VHLVEVLVEEDGDLQQRARAEPRHAHAAVSLEAEERPEPFLAAPRRAELDEEVRDLPLDVPEPVRRPRPHDEHLPGAQDAPPQSEAEAKPARDALETLPLARVHVHRHESTGPDEQLAGHACGRTPAEDDVLTRHGIRDHVYHGLDRLI
jgi:hypothetical protein